MTIYADTHVLVWLFYHEIGRLGSAARQALDQNEILASPAVVLEMEFLHEIGRTQHSALTVVDRLAADIGLRVCDLPFRTVVEYALKELGPGSVRPLNRGQCQSSGGPAGHQRRENPPALFPRHLVNLRPGLARPGYSLYSSS
jgi:hypothetical protein